MKLDNLVRWAARKYLLGSGVIEVEEWATALLRNKRPSDTATAMVVVDTLWCIAAALPIFMLVALAATAADVGTLRIRSRQSREQSRG